MNPDPGNAASCADRQRSRRWHVQFPCVLRRWECQPHQHKHERSPTESMRRLLSHEHAPATEGGSYSVRITPNALTLRQGDIGSGIQNVEQLPNERPPKRYRVDTLLLPFVVCLLDLQMQLAHHVEQCLEVNIPTGGTAANVVRIIHVFFLEATIPLSALFPASKAFATKQGKHGMGLHSCEQRGGDADDRGRTPNGLSPRKECSVCHHHCSAANRRD